MRRLHTATAAFLAVTVGCEPPTASITDAPFRLEVACSFPSLTTNDFITAFDFGPDGTLWVTSLRGVIIRVRNGVGTTFDATAILGVAQLNDLFIDGAGRPWVTGGASVAVFDSNVWSRQDPTDYMGLAPKVRQVAVNAAGDVLLEVGDVGAGGLLLRRGGTWQAITPANAPLPSPLVNEIEVAPDGSFWIASAQFQGNGGLTHLVGNQIVDVFDKVHTQLLYNWIDDIAIAPDRIWLGFAVPIYSVFGEPDGGIQGLPFSGGAPVSRFPFETGLTSNRVEAMVWSMAGELWFTTGLDEDSECRTCLSGIGVMDAGGSFHVISNLNSNLAGNEYLPAIAEGPGGAIYVARAERKEISRVLRE